MNGMLPLRFARSALCVRHSRFTVAVATAVLAGVTFASLSSSPLFVREAHAQKVDPEVQKHFQVGNQLYEEGRYPDALVEYDAAYAKSKNWKILYNRGQCLVMLKREPEAIDDFEQYLKEGGDQVPATRRNDVETDIAKLKERLGTITVDGAPAGSEVWVDARRIGTTPLPKALLAGAGTHDIEVHPPPNFGAQPFRQTVAVVAGGKATVNVSFGSPEVALTPDAPTSGAQPQPADVPPPSQIAPVLPKRPPGGLASPAVNLALQLGTSIPAGDYHGGDARALGALELAVAYRINGFFELGIFASGAAGTYGVQSSVSSGYDASLGRVSVDSNADYSYGILGVRGRMHLLRTKQIDGWFGVDLGAWTESWGFRGQDAFTYKASSAAFGLSVGLDVPIARDWAIGGALRFLSASASNGHRTDCAIHSSYSVCNSGYLPGEGASGEDKSTTRGFFDLGLHLVYVFRLGPDAQPPASPAAAPATAKLGASAF